MEGIMFILLTLTYPKPTTTVVYSEVHLLVVAGWSWFRISALIVSKLFKNLSTAPRSDMGH